MNDLITQREFAVMNGVSEAAVSKLVSSGVVTLVGGRIDPQKALAQIAAARDPSWASKFAQPESEQTSKGPTLTQAKTRQITADAISREMLVAEKSGTLQDKEGATLAFASAIKTFTTTVLAVPDKLPYPREQQIEIGNALRTAIKDAASLLPADLEAARAFLSTE